jgi:hypothetical protein
VLKGLIAGIAVVAAGVPAPAWIGRVVPGPIVAWREADVLGTSIPEGIAVNRLGGTLGLNVVDSRTNPPTLAAERDLPDGAVRWLFAGRRDGLARDEIALDVARGNGETAYLFRVKGRLVLVRTARGRHLTRAALK